MVPEFGRMNWQQKLGDFNDRCHLLGLDSKDTMISIDVLEATPWRYLADGTGDFKAGDFIDFGVGVEPRYSRDSSWEGKE